LDDGSLGQGKFDAIGPSKDLLGQSARGSWMNGQARNSHPRANFQGGIYPGRC
jgi:hypothetical protein